MNTIITWLMVGGLVGWISSLIMRIASQQVVLLNVVAGVFGAAVGRWLLISLVGVSATDQSIFSLSSLIVSLLGAAILVALVNLIRCGVIATSRLERVHSHRRS